jgi:hypothetical protein
MALEPVECPSKPVCCCGVLRRDLGECISGVPSSARPSSGSDSQTSWQRESREGRWRSDGWRGGRRALGRNTRYPRSPPLGSSVPTAPARGVLALSTNSPFVMDVQMNMGLVYAQNAPTASQPLDGRSLGRDSQPPSGTHAATARQSPLQSSSPAPSASAKRQSNRSVLCKNRGCNGLAVGRAANRQRKCAPITRFRSPRMPISKGVYAHALRLPCRAL